MSVVPALPTIGFTTAEVLAQIQVAVQALNSIITNFNPGGVTETYCEALALALGDDAFAISNGKINGVYQALEALQSAEYIITASGTALDNKCADVGIYRKAATAANTPLAITFTLLSGVGPATIASGVVLAQPNADPTQAPTLYQTTSTVAVPTGATSSTPADVVCLSNGTAGNAPIGAINQIISGASGYTAVNVIPVIGGTNTEDDDSLRARGLAAIPNASQCTVSALKQAALTYAGITSAQVVDLTDDMGNYPAVGHAQIYVDDGSGNIAGHTTTTADFVMPSIGNTVTVTVMDNTVFAVGAEVEITGNNGKALIATITDDPTGSYTFETIAVITGVAGDTVTHPASVNSPHSGAITAFQTDLDNGLWRSAGCIVDVSGSTQRPITITMSIYCSQSVVGFTATETEIVAAVQSALFNFVNGLGIGIPIPLSSIVEVAKEVLGVAEVILNTPSNPNILLINGTPADFGVSNGLITLSPGQTCRVRELSDITVSSVSSVDY